MGLQPTHRTTVFIYLDSSVYVCMHVSTRPPPPVMLCEALTLRSFIKTIIRHSHGTDQTYSSTQLHNQLLQR